MENSTNLKKENEDLLAFFKKDLKINSKKLRIGFWVICTILWLLLYWADNESFAEFFAPLNLFTFSLLTLLITESIVFVHRKMTRKSKNAWGVIMSSIVGIILGLGLTIVVCFSLFWALMYFIYG